MKTYDSTNLQEFKSKDGTGEFFKAMKIDKIGNAKTDKHPTLRWALYSAETEKGRRFVRVDNGYMNVYEPAVGDYYILFQSGDESCESGRVFEHTYHPIPGTGTLSEDLEYTKTMKQREMERIHEEKSLLDMSEEEMDALSDMLLADTFDDPWRHRSEGMKCKSCMWFVEKQNSSVQREDKLIGRCRRHAPTMNGYPVVYSNDWCGDHKLDENKL